MPEMSAIHNDAGGELAGVSRVLLRSAIDQSLQSFCMGPPLRRGHTVPPAPLQSCHPVDQPVFASEAVGGDGPTEREQPASFAGRRPPGCDRSVVASAPK
jgi:hypothetical protein